MSARKKVVPLSDASSPPARRRIARKLARQIERRLFEMMMATPLSPEDAERAAFVALQAVRALSGEELAYVDETLPALKRVARLLRGVDGPDGDRQELRTLSILVVAWAEVPRSELPSDAMLRHQLGAVDKRINAKTFMAAVDAYRAGKALTGAVAELLVASQALGTRGSDRGAVQRRVTNALDPELRKRRYTRA